MEYENKIEQAAKMFINLDLEDFIVVESVINRIIKTKESSVEHGTRQKNV